MSERKYYVIVEIGKHENGGFDVALVRGSMKDLDLTIVNYATASGGTVDDYLEYIRKSKPYLMFEN